MLAFSRITSVLFFVLSLSLFTYAAPTPAYNLNEVAPSYENGQRVYDLVVKLRTEVEAHAKVIAKIAVFADVDAELSHMMGNIKTCAEAVIAVGSNVTVDDTVKAKIAAEAVVQLCVSLVAKFGILVLLTILAKIDIRLQLLSLNLGVCIEGTVALVAKIVVKLGLSVFASIHLGLCIQVLGLLNITL